VYAHDHPNNNPFMSGAISKKRIILDRYGHLMPGAEAEAAGLLDAYLGAAAERSAEQVRGASGASLTTDGGKPHE